jgi:hypothetical protein
MRTACQWRYRIIGGHGAAKMRRHRSGGRGPSLLTDLLFSAWSLSKLAEFLVAEVPYL